MMADVSSLLATTIPLSWAAAVSPVTLSIFLIMISMSKNPKIAGFSFYFGAIVVLLITLVLGFFLGKTLTAAGATDQVTMASIDIFLGAILFLLGLRNLVSKEEGKSSHILNIIQVKDDASNLYKISRYFGIGVIAFLLNFSTAIFVLQVGRVIGIANQGFGNDLIAIIILILIALLIIEIPILFFVITPHKAEKMIEPVNVWISKHSSLVTGLFCLAIGIYIVYDGLNKLGLT